MSTKTITLPTLLLLTIGCGPSTNKDGAGEELATFAEATDQQIILAFIVSTGQDLIVASIYGTAPMMAAEMGSPCVETTQHENAIQYSPTDSDRCQGEMTGTLTIIFDDDGQTDTMVWDHMVWVDVDGEESYEAHGSLSMNPQYIEADLRHTIPEIGELESRVRMRVDQTSNDMGLSHIDGSSAAVEGLGDFDLFGTANWSTAEADIEMVGNDTLGMYMAQEGNCVNFEIDGEPIDVEDAPPACQD